MSWQEDHSYDRASDAQARVLRALRDGAFIDLVSFVPALDVGGRREQVHHRTFWALVARGWIDDGPVAVSMGRRWSITDVGRDVLSTWEERR